jgi:TRAP-type C4-dicarboxylate transport system substrate-binding protein
MKSWKTVFILSAVFLLFSLVIIFPVFAQQKFVLKFNHVLGPKEPYHQGFTDWAKAVDQKTKGGFKIDVFHSAQLGVEEDIIEQMRQGANVGQNTDSARLGNYVPGIAVMNGPYFATTLEEVIKIKNTPTVKA